MNEDRRTLVILAVNGLLYFALNQVNAVLAPLSLHLSLDALYLLFAFLYLKTNQGLLIGFLTALFIDAALPVPFGVHTILYFCTLAALLRMRRELRRDNPRHIVLAAFWSNFFIMLGLSLLVGKGLLAQWDFWLRFCSDLAISQLLLIFLVRWWVDAQRQVLLLWDIDVGSELQQF